MTKRILTDEHRRQIIEAERTITDIIPVIDALEECGTQCQEVREAAQETLKRLAAFKKNFTQARAKGK